MANSTVYPYGTGGTIPSSIGLVNDLKTGGVDKALTAEQGKVIGIRLDELLDDAVNLGPFELGSINTPDPQGVIPDYSSNTRIRNQQQSIEVTGEYQFSINNGYLFLIYVVDKLIAAEWRTSLYISLNRGDSYRIAIKQAVDTDYSSYTNEQISELFVESGMAMRGGTLVPRIKDEIGEADLEVADENGLPLVRFENGHIRTKYFDSSIPSTKVDDSDVEGDLHIEDADGLILATFKNGHIQTKNFDSSKISTNSSGNGPMVEMGLPFDVPKVYIDSETLQPNATNNTISPLSYSGTKAGDPVGSVDTDEVTLRFVSQSINFTDNIEINYQGATSLADPKKGFGIDTHDKHKFGKWRAFDSFHLKAFYEDYIKCRDWVCNQLMEQIYLSRPSSELRPFLKYNNFNNDYRSFFGSNALCHVDGFPIELYINDVYWGVYVWRLKKDKANYQFTKGDSQHILLDSQDWFSSNGSFKWTGVEVRNPKTLYCTTVVDGKYQKYDGDNPTELIDSTMQYYDSENPGHVLTNEVKQRIVAWKDFMWNITSATSKGSIEQHFDMQEFIDCYLLLYVCNVWDSWSRNTLYGTWDGTHFAPLIYDLNNSFNGFGGKNSGTYHAYYPPTSEPYNQKARNMSWFVGLETIYAQEIRLRYKELVERGIFTTENIAGLFDRFAMWVGFDAYSSEATRWPNIPSYVANNRDRDQMSILREWINSRLEYVNSKLL